MREYVKHHHFSPDSERLLREVAKIINGYLAQGLKLTLRQTYYQCIVRNLFPNTEKSYKKLSGLLSDARLGGHIDWDAIEDRIRRPRIPTEFDNIDDLVNVALKSYRLPRWVGQQVYVEICVEKDALAGVIAPIAHEYHIPMTVNRGYSSQTAMYDMGKRFIEACFEEAVYEDLAEVALREKELASDMAEKLRRLWKGIKMLDATKSKLKRRPVLFYLGDHDPSGEDMVRDIEERLDMFGIEVEVRKLALTMDQIEEYNPPPNPAKTTDPRAAEYIEKHGAVSWEVDALPPDVLDGIIREALDSVIDRVVMDKVIERENKDKKALEKALASVRKPKDKKGKK